MKKERKVISSLWRKHNLALCFYFISTALFLLSERLTAGSLGFPFDDSWIFAQYTRNLANGHGFCFNIGEPSSGFTSFLWLLLCAFAYKLTGEFVVPMKAMGILFGAGCILMVHLIIETLTGDERKAQWGACLIAFFAPLVANSLAGMEGSLYAFTALVGIWLHLRWRTIPSLRWLWEGIWWGIAALARPENLLLWGITAADKLWRNRSKRQIVLVWLALQMVFLLLLASLWIGVNLNTTGTPFPGTYLAKVLPARKVFYGHWGIPLGISIALIQGLMAWLSYMVALFPTAISLAIWQLFVRVRHRRVQCIGIAKSSQSLWLFGVAAVMVGIQAVQYPTKTLTIWGHWGRYLLPAYLMSGLSLVMSLPSARWVLPIALLGMLPSYALIVPEYAQWVELTQRVHIRFGKWLNVHTQPNAVIATHDIGAIGFFSHHRIFDTQGLIHTDIAQRLFELWQDDNAMLYELQRRSVGYLVVSNSWRLVKMHPELFELLQSEAGWGLDERNRFCIFRIHWERIKDETGRQREFGFVKKGQKG